MAMTAKQRKYLLSIAEKKTYCVSACMSFFGVLEKARYAQCPDDLRRVLRNNGYHVRSRLSKLGKRKQVSVSGLIKEIRSGKMLDYGDYLVQVEKHVLVISAATGAVECDTDPRYRGDRRKILNVWLVYKLF